MNKIEVGFKLSEGAVLPEYQTAHASGADLASNEHVILMPGEVKAVGTGLFPEIPEGYEIQVRPRSGLALKQQVLILNSPGTIDADYRGELKVIIKNLNPESPLEITKGMRIAQAIVAPVTRGVFVQKETISETARGENGFGHTGVSTPVTAETIPEAKTETKVEVKDETPAPVQEVEPVNEPTPAETLVASVDANEQPAVGEGQ